jgi:uncharacterized membrane protein
VYGPPCGGDGDSFAPITPQAINSAGQVAGYYGGCLGGADTAFFWTAEQGIIAIANPESVNSARATANADQTRGRLTLGPVTGQFVYSQPSGLRRGFVFDGALAALIDPLPDHIWCDPLGINFSRIVVGYSTHPVTGWHAFQWDDGVLASLNLPIGPSSQATDVNDAADITGWMGLGGIFGEPHGFLWQAGRVTDMGIPEGATGTEPEAINNNRQIVGVIQYLQKEPELALTKRAFAWSDGTFSQLPVLPKFESSRALDLNDDGLIVGECDADAAGLPARAVLWHNGVVYDLNDMVPDPDDVIFLSLAEGINNDGIIIAKCDCGPEHDDHTALVILTPAYPAIGDLNCDEIVNVVDLSILLAQWGPGDSLSADFNGDGIVGPFDLAQLLANWGSATELSD